MNADANSPLGVFDSGVGGLTVVRALREILPNESIIYLGDTARVPYGVKSVATIEHFTAQITEFLLQRDVKMLIIACNTMAAVAALGLFFAIKRACSYSFHEIAMRAPALAAVAVCVVHARHGVARRDDGAAQGGRNAERRKGDAALSHASYSQVHRMRLL